MAKEDIREIVESKKELPKITKEDRRKTMKEQLRNSRTIDLGDGTGTKKKDDKEEKPESIGDTSEESPIQEEKPEDAEKKMTNLEEGLVQPEWVKRCIEKFGEERCNNLHKIPKQAVDIATSDPFKIRWEISEGVITSWYDDVRAFKSTDDAENLLRMLVKYDAGRDDVFVPNPGTKMNMTIVMDEDQESDFLVERDPIEIDTNSLGRNVIFLTALPSGEEVEGVEGQDNIQGGNKDLNTGTNFL